MTTAHSYARILTGWYLKGLPKLKFFVRTSLITSKTIPILVRPACFMCTCKMPVVHATRPSTPTSPAWLSAWLAGWNGNTS